MRKISANYIISAHQPPVKNGILVLNDKNEIVELRENVPHKEEARLEFYNGVIVPGFINGHCHLELSRLKGTIEMHAGLSAFIVALLRERGHANREDLIRSAEKHDRLMYQKGIVATGDVCNSNITAEIKNKSKINYHTFVELYGLNTQKNDAVLETGEKLYREFAKNGPETVSLTPHSWYSVNTDLFKKTICLPVNHSKTLSIHHQESREEISLFNERGGPLYKMLNKNKNGTAFWDNHKREQYKVFEDIASPVLLVHNTRTTRMDVEKINQSIQHPYWVTCAKSNLFIENQLPDLYMLRDSGQDIVLGTDSLASNDSLCLLEEIKTIMGHFNNIPFFETIKWATLNGAKALNMDTKLGSFETGKQPGVNLISNFDFTKFVPGKDCTIKPLV